MKKNIKNLQPRRTLKAILSIDVETGHLVRIDLVANDSREEEIAGHAIEKLLGCTWLKRVQRFFGVQR